MPILNRAPPNRTRFYVESANANALTIRNLGHFTAHIYCLQIKAACCFKCLASKRTSFFLMPRAALGRTCRLPDYAECRRVSVLNFLISVGFHALAANCIRHNPAVFSGLAVTPGIRKTYEEKTCVGRETHSRQPVRVACSDVCNRVEGCGEVDYRDRTICSKPIRSALNRPYTTR